MTRVLIVDDKQDNLYLLRALLTGHGCEVEEARHGAEALVKARQWPPHLVISDLLMPVMDGFTLLRHWKSDERLRQIPFVVYTGTYTEPKDERLALSLGADAFIIKPVEPEPFLALIQEVLAKGEAGLLFPAKLPTGDEEVRLKQYNESLIHKLEEKAFQLEQANRALAEDIAERRRTEEALHRSTSLLQAAFDATADGILAVDREGRVIAFNQRFVEMWGIPESAVEKADDHQLFARVMERLKDPDGFTRKVEALHNEPEKESWDIVEFKDGRVFERFSKLQRMGDEIVGRVWDFRDITGRKRMEDELRKSRDELELRVEERTAELKSYMSKLRESNQALEDFAFIASHDLQEPLRKVSTFGNMLRQKYNDSLEQTGNDYLNRMLDAAQRMQSLLKGLLEYSKVTTKADPFVEVELAEIVGEVLCDLEIKIKRTGAEVRVLELPVVKADPTQMRQLFQNLIANALKFHKEDDKPAIEVSSAVAEGKLRIMVKDNGIGFEEKHLERIFAPFERLHGRSSQYEGTGMGLAICRRIVQRHGGSITAKSTLGQETTFIITLPSKQPD